MSRWRAQSPEQVVAGASQVLPFWVSLILVMIIAYYVARMVWLFFPADEEMLWMPPSAPTSSAATRNDGTPARNYQPIVDAHLFGTASADDVEVVEETDDAPDTRLNLKLRAAVAAVDEQVAHAIIADGTGEEKVYFIKDTVPGGAMLHRVQTDRVILNRGGTLEALRLPRDYTQGARPAPRSASNRGTAQNSIQQVLANNAASLTEVLRPQPYMPNGQLRGYRVFPGRNRQQFLRLGLRPGDLVTEINGVALNNPAQGMEVFQSLGNSTQVSVTIERGGTSQVLNLDTSQITAATDTKR